MKKFLPLIFGLFLGILRAQDAGTPETAAPAPAGEETAVPAAAPAAAEAAPAPAVTPEVEVRQLRTDIQGLYNQKAAMSLKEKKAEITGQLWTKINRLRELESQYPHLRVYEMPLPPPRQLPPNPSPAPMTSSQQWAMPAPVPPQPTYAAPPQTPVPEPTPVVSIWAAPQSQPSQAPALPSGPVAQLEAEIHALDLQISDPANIQMRSMLQQQLYEKIHQLHEMKKTGGGSAYVPAPTPMPLSAPTPMPAPAASYAPAPSNPSNQGWELPSNPPPPAQPAPQQLPQPMVSEAPAPAPQPAPAMQPTMAPSYPPASSGFMVYSAEELGLGKGTQQDLDDVARNFQSGDQTAAQNRWSSYLQGEADALAGQRSRIEAMMYYIVRQAFIESDPAAPASAAMVDAARRKKDPNLIAQTQADFNQFLNSRPDLTGKIQGALAALRSMVK